MASTNRDQKACPHCPEQVIEHECDFLNECTKYDLHKMADTIQQPYVEQSTTSKREICLYTNYIMSAEVIAKFIADNLP